MARNKLHDKTVKDAKPKEKMYRLSDGGCLFLVVAPKGGKRWQYRYVFDGKEKTLSLGIYPGVSLAMARERRDAAERILASGVDPSAKRQSDRAAAKAAKIPEQNTFQQVAERWLATRCNGLSSGYVQSFTSQLHRDVFPAIGKMPISQVKADVLREVVLRIEMRSADVAKRVLQKIGQIMRYAVALGLAEYDPTPNLRGLIEKPVVQHFRHTTDKAELAHVLRAIDVYRGTPQVRAALRLMPMLLVRPGELRKAEWSELDLDLAEWRIPASKMKGRIEHVVPLPGQAVVILAELRRLTGSDKYVFSVRTGRPMSENALTVALKSMGLDLTAHGFRATASTMLNECGLFRHDVIERQLAHGERDKVRASYNHAQLMPERKAMLQWWADHLDELKAGCKVLPFCAGGDV